MNKKAKDFFCIVLLAIAIALPLSFIKATKEIDKNDYKKVDTIEREKSVSYKKEIHVNNVESEFLPKNVVEIKLNPIKELSGLSVKQILTLRKNAVKNSTLFSNLKYSPNPQVYMIEDGLPWISAYEITCNGSRDNSNIGKGASRESVGILNPELMFYINMNSMSFKYRNYCSTVDYLIPYKAYFNPQSKTITAHINYKDYYAKNKVYYSNILNDSNAKDLGYNYSYMDDYSNINFKFEENLSTKLVSTKSFFHRGFACGLPSGCNNVSPYVREFEFYLTDVPATAHIKLWKSKPITVEEEADLNYVMIFD